MTEAKREPAFWVVKTACGYVSAEIGGTVSVRMRYTDRAAAERAAPIAFGGGRVLPVYVTTRKVKRGHSWAWACKRMLEGKRVRLSTWSGAIYMGRKDVVRYVGDAGEVLVVSKNEMARTDWELAE